MLTVSSMLGYGQSIPYACTNSMESYGVAGQPNSVFMWTVTGGNIVDGQGNDTVVVTWNNQRGAHQVEVTEQTEFGCFGTPVTANVDINAPVANIGDNEAVCAGDSFEFNASVSYITPLTYLWSDSSKNSIDYKKDAGIIWVKITGTDGCYDYDSAVLAVNPLPVVNIGRDTTLCGTNLLTLDAGDFSIYDWSNGSIASTITIDGQRTEPQDYWVTVTDENGCKASDTVLIGVCDVYLLFSNIPNTLTPNGDGHNDKWEVPYISQFPDAVLEIYDRWGRLIYRKNHFDDDICWDGYSLSGKKMPMDAYFYVIDLGLKHVKPLTGYINLIDK